MLIINFETVLCAHAGFGRQLEPAFVTSRHRQRTLAVFELHCDGGGFGRPQAKSRRSVVAKFRAEWHFVLALHAAGGFLRSLPRTRLAARSTSSASDRACRG